VRDLIRKACGEAFTEHYAASIFVPYWDYFSQGEHSCLERWRARRGPEVSSAGSRG
jgi:hypothetical protein